MIWFVTILSTVAAIGHLSGLLPQPPNWVTGVLWLSISAFCLCRALDLE